MDIKELREFINLSQKQFADKYGIPVRTLQKWEQHAAEPLPYLISLVQDDIEDEEYFSIEKYMIKPKNTFKVTRKKRFMNIEHVHPIQQENIEKVLEVLTKHKSVKKVTQSMHICFMIHFLPVRVLIKKCVQ